MAIKQIESDIGKCTNETELQQLSAKLSTKENIYNSLTQEIVAEKTHINSLTVQMNSINLPFSSDNGM